MRLKPVSALPFKLTQFSTRTLLKHKVHIGSNLTNLNSTFFRYGFFQWDLTKRSVQIRLKYSLYYLKTAVNILSAVVQSHGTILIIQEQSAFSLEFVALLKQTRQPLALRPWLPGTLSNFRVLRQTYLKVFYLKRELTKHFAILYEKLNITANTKKYVQSKINVNKLSKELVKYVDSLSSLPHLVILGNSLHSHLAVNEARLLGIPSIGLIDSNGSVFAVNYFIPWNNKSLTSLGLFFQIIALTILKGQLLIRQTFLFKLAHKKQIQLKKQKLAIVPLTAIPVFKQTYSKEQLNAPAAFLKQLLTTFSQRTRVSSGYLRKLQTVITASRHAQQFHEIAEVLAPIHLVSSRWGFYASTLVVGLSDQPRVVWGLAQKGATPVPHITASRKASRFTPNALYTKLNSGAQQHADRFAFRVHRPIVTAAVLPRFPLLVLGAVKSLLAISTTYQAKPLEGATTAFFPQIIKPTSFIGAPPFVRFSRLV